VIEMKFKEGSLPYLYKDRIEYLYRFQELLRLYHNKKGLDFRDGKITEEEFRNFQSTWFNPRNNLVCAEINKCKEHFKKIAVDIDIESIEES